jgi:hypothetical protein
VVEDASRADDRNVDLPEMRSPYRARERHTRLDSTPVLNGTDVATVN